MNKLLLTVVAVICLTAPISVRGEESGALVLTADSFDSELAKSALFVKFYAPWCGHCKRLEPTWDELANEYVSNFKAIRIAKIDCTIHKSKCQEFEVRGYPTLKLLVGKDVHAFSGARNIDTFKTFIGKHINVHEDKHDATAEEKDKHVDDTKAAAADNANIKEGTAIAADAASFNNLITGDAFVKFYAPWCGHCKRLAPAWEELAQKVAGTGIRIVKVDCTEHASLCQQYEVRGYPTLYYFKNGAKLADRYSGSRSLDAMYDYVIEQSGKKAEEQPAEAAADAGGDEEIKIEDGLMVLTDGTFEAAVNSKKFVLVKFYAPWCGHCKRLAPAWDELASKFASSDSAAVAKIDCTQWSATCSKFSVRGYPTLLLFEDGKQGEKYSGGRDVSSLSKFLSGKAGHDEL